MVRKKPKAIQEVAQTIPDEKRAQFAPFLATLDAVREYMTISADFMQIGENMYFPLTVYKEIQYTEAGDVLEPGNHFFDGSNEAVIRAKPIDGHPLEAYQLSPVMIDGAPLVLGSLVYAVFQYMPLSQPQRKKLLEFMKIDDDDDADKALLPVIAAHKLENLDFPIDKVNNRVWQLLEEADGQTWNIDVAKNGSKKTIDVLYCLDIEDMDDVSITRKLEPYDKRLYIAVDAICHIGYFNMSYQQLYNAMGYEGRAGKADIEKMDASLTKMSSARLFIDNTQEARAYKYDKFIYDGALLPMERIKGVINGQVADAAIHVFRVPPLMAFARERKQLTTIKRRVLGSPLNKTSQNLCIEDYLIYRIARIKNGTSKNKILLSTIYENAGITTIKQKQRAPAKIKQLLDHYVKCGFIKGYSPEELDDLKKIDGVTIRY